MNAGVVLSAIEVGHPFEIMFVAPSHEAAADLIEVVLQHLQRGQDWLRGHEDLADQKKKGAYSLCSLRNLLEINSININLRF